MRLFGMWAVFGVLVLSSVAGAGVGRAGSHLDAPHLIVDSAMDATDFYAHICPDAPELVCLIADYSPVFAGPGVSFATDARYEINIDRDGAGRPDLVYRWTF